MAMIIPHVPCLWLTRRDHCRCVPLVFPLNFSVQAISTCIMITEIDTVSVLEFSTTTIQSSINNIISPSLFATLQSAGAVGYGVATVYPVVQVMGGTIASVKEIREQLLAMAEITHSEFNRWFNQSWPQSWE